MSRRATLQHACTGKPTERQEDLVNLTAEEAIEHLCTGKVSAVEYSEALLAQNKLTACLNNFAALEPQQVQQGLICQFL